MAKLLSLFYYLFFLSVDSILVFLKAGLYYSIVASKLTARRHFVFCFLDQN